MIGYRVEKSEQLIKKQLQTYNCNDELMVMRITKLHELRTKDWILRQPIVAQDDSKRKDK